MNTYVRAARRADDGSLGRITGRVLHLSVYALDRPETVTVRGFGQHVPLCGGPSGAAAVERWRLTGPWADGWERHSHWPVCHRCIRALDRLLSDLNAQDDRHDDHRRALGEDDAYPPDATPLPDFERTDTP